jgi:hypothetical protein
MVVQEKDRARNYQGLDMRPLPAGWVLEWYAPTHRRLHKRFENICAWHAPMDLPNGDIHSLPTLWWNHGRRCWMDHIPKHHNGMSSSAPCRTLRAFIRHLHRHQHQLRGYEVALYNSFMGYEVTATYVGD